MKRREIKFRDRHGDLVGRQNGMTFYIMKEPGLPDTCAPAHSVFVDPGDERTMVSTGGYQYFHLDEAKELCQQIASGEITLEALRARYEAEDATRERETIQKAAEREEGKVMSWPGPKGEPGPYGAATELELVEHVISELEEAEGCSERIEAEDGHNHKRVVDGWVLTQALGALQNYEALLRQPLYELVSHGFCHIGHPKKVPESIG